MFPTVSGRKNLCSVKRFDRSHRRRLKWKLATKTVNVSMPLNLEAGRNR